MKPGGASEGTLQELLPGDAGEGVAQIEEGIDQGLFIEKHLNPQEGLVFGMLLQGYSMGEIRQKSRLSESGLSRMCADIGERWKRFSQQEASGGI